MIKSPDSEGNRSLPSRIDPEERMKIIAISNNKQWQDDQHREYAAALQILGKRLVVDMDHQAQSTYHLGCS